MTDDDIPARPPALEGILRDTTAIAFNMASEPKTGSLLRALAASKPAGRILELGTGTGVGTAWLLAGMDAESRLTTVDNDSAAQEVARRHLGMDARVTFHLRDCEEFLTTQTVGHFDLVYADTWAGKFSHLDDALRLVTVGGIYLVDDLLPQDNWPEGHAAKVPPLLSDLESRREFVSVKLAWASGLLILVRTRGN
jgi:predicted O-methyltransferase YrrM